MRKILAFAMIFCLSVNAGAFGTDWLTNFEDVPHMPDIYAIQDDGFVYSIPDGKIIQTTIASDVVSRKQFQRFYRDALYELGWKKINEDRKIQIFERDGEELTIDIIEPDPLKAQFTLKPKD